MQPEGEKKMVQPQEYVGTAQEIAEHYAAVISLAGLEP